MRFTDLKYSVISWRCIFEQ